MSNPNPKLMFTPYAWSKLLTMRDLGPTEVGGFGITHPKNPFSVEDFRTIKQECSATFVALDDDAVNEFLEDCFAEEIVPSQCMRVWIHTHPGNCAKPSRYDEDVFKRVFGNCDYAVMFILAKGGDTYCRVRAKHPGIEMEIKCGVNWYADCPAINQTLFEEEYKRNVTVEKPVPLRSQKSQVIVSVKEKMTEEERNNELLLDAGFSQEEIDHYTDLGYTHAEIVMNEFPGYLS